MKTTAQRKRVKHVKESSHVESTATAIPCDVEVIVNNRRTVALSKRGGLFVVDDAATLQATAGGLQAVLGKVQRLIRAGGES